MQIDKEALRRHYASLSDEELLAMDPSELTEIAQQIYEAEIHKRNLTGEDEEEGDAQDLAPGFELDEEDPDWLESAAVACNFSSPPGVVVAPEAARACDVLRAAGIPSHIAVVEADHEHYMEYQVMVPGPLSLRATAVLDKQIFNEELENNWRTHLENLTDQELHALHPAEICQGLVDRVERLKRVYREELERRSIRT